MEVAGEAQTRKNCPRMTGGRRLSPWHPTKHPWMSNTAKTVAIMGVKKPGVHVRRKATRRRGKMQTYLPPAPEIRVRMPATPCEMRMAATVSTTPSRSHRISGTLICLCSLMRDRGKKKKKRRGRGGGGGGKGVQPGNHCWGVAWTEMHPFQRSKSRDGCDSC